MHECPYCSADLREAPRRNESRTDAGMGGKSLGDELVTCAACDGVIDGFTTH